MAKAEELKTTVRQVIEELNKGNLDKLDELYAADLVCHTPPYPDKKGLESYKQYVANWFRAFPNSQFTIEEIIAEGNTVVARLTYRGTHTGPLGSIPPTGKQASGPGCIVYHLVDGKIVEEWDYWDELGFWQQLGYKLVPPQEQGEE